MKKKSVFLILICLLLTMTLPTFVACKGHETMSFGSYPQAQVTDGALIARLNAAAGALPTAADSHAWTSYGYYYEGSTSPDYMWYVDLEDGGERYRGVYFTQYRLGNTDMARAEYGDDGWFDDSYQDNNGYDLSTVYWFKFEPVKWVVLEETDGELLLLSERILDSQQFCHDPTTSGDVPATPFPHGGRTGYSGNYALSDIRAWLNGAFYVSAFTEEEKAKILLTTVDNSARSTNPNKDPEDRNNGVNENACEDTEDYVFLLSVREATNKEYGFSANRLAADTARRKQATDYAGSQGILRSVESKYKGNGYWTLRSPDYSDGNYAAVVFDDGDAEAMIRVSDTYSGVVPALRIKKA